MKANSDDLVVRITAAEAECENRPNPVVDDGK
jgi:hypothetical protein